MLLPWRTVWRNVALGPEARGRLRGGRAARNDPRIVRALERVGLSAFDNAFPHQLSEDGSAQRVALARALAGEPAVLLMDEPLWQTSGFTALFVTHDVDEALLLADRIIVSSERPGRIIGDLAIDINRPRHRTDSRFEAKRAEVSSLRGFPD